MDAWTNERTNERTNACHRATARKNECNALPSVDTTTDYNLCDLPSLPPSLLEALSHCRVATADVRDKCFDDERQTVNSNETTTTTTTTSFVVIVVVVVVVGW